MSSKPMLDDLIADWLRETAPAAPPAHVQGDLFELIRRSRQRYGRWAPIRDRWLRSQPLVLRLAAIVLTLSLVAGAAIWSSLSGAGPTVPVTTPTPGTSQSPQAAATAGPSSSSDAHATLTPTGGQRRTTTDFSIPFSYVIADGSPLVPSHRRSATQIGWVDPQGLPAEWLPEDESQASKVVVAVVSLPWVHGCASRSGVSGRTPVSSTPDAFLTDLAGIGGLIVTRRDATSLAGLPALAADVEATPSCTTDLHIHGPLTGLVGSDALSIVPSRLIVAAADGQLLLLEITAPTKEELASFLPSALEFVQSIEFAGESVSGNPRRSQVPVASVGPAATTVGFDPAFSYVLRPDSALKPAVAGPRTDEIAWVVGDDVGSPLSNDDVGGQLPEAGNRSGIIVAVVSEPWMHVCPRAVRTTTLGMTPGQFLADLSIRGRIDMGIPAATSVDGLPAFTTDLTSAPCANVDLHIGGPTTGQHVNALQFLPSRLVVASRDGQLILIDIWGRTRDDWVDILAEASQFVRSIRFLP